MGNPKVNIAWQIKPSEGSWITQQARQGLNVMVKAKLLESQCQEGEAVPHRNSR
jgi:hypothetical protein